MNKKNIVKSPVTQDKQLVNSQENNYLILVAAPVAAYLINKVFHLCNNVMMNHYEFKGTFKKTGFDFSFKPIDIVE